MSRPKNEIEKSNQDDQQDRDAKRAELSKQMKASAEQDIMDFKQALAEVRKEMFSETEKPKVKKS